MDDRLLPNVLRVCINDTEKRTAYLTIRDILSNRACAIASNGFVWKQSTTADMAAVSSGHIILVEIVLDVLSRLGEEDADAINDLLVHLRGLWDVVEFKIVSSDLLNIYTLAFLRPSRLINYGPVDCPISHVIRENAFNMLDGLFRKMEILVTEHNSKSSPFPPLVYVTFIAFDFSYSQYNQLCLSR